MRILFYSTNSSIFDGANTNIQTRPLLSSQWEELAKSHPEHKFLIATQKPGMFLIDMNQNEIAGKAENVDYFLIEDDEESKIADFLSSLEPDIAVAATFYTPPFDWLTAKDAVIAEKLRSRNIRTICHPIEAALICFDKWQTHQFFQKCGANCPNAVYFNHELFINGGNRRTIKSNVYRTAFFEQLKKLSFPVIIKDTTGLSSYGMDVVDTFEAAKSIILSKKTTSSRIIEEMISGGQFGLEAIRLKINGRHITRVFPPFKFSVNRYGITSPKQSVKAGPVFNKKEYRLDELYGMIYGLCEKLDLNGSANFDLVFNQDEKKWYVLEINPRLSGMTTTYASSMGKTVPQMLFELLGLSEQGLLPESGFRPAMNIKFPILSLEKLKKAESLPFVDFVSQQENLGARQLREKGYAEIVFSGRSFKELKKNLRTLKEEFKNEMEEIFFNKATELLEPLMR